MKNGNVGEGLGSAGDGDVKVAQRNLVGGVSDRLICRRAGSADGEGLHSFRQQGHQRHFAGDVGRDHRWNHCPKNQCLDFLAVQIRALQQLSDAQFAEVDRGDGFERSPGFCERRPDTGD